MRLICDAMMATDDITECMFTVGSVVACVNCFDVKIEGEVIAFDYNKRLLILKSVNPNGGQSDVNWINLEFVKNVTINKEVKHEDVNTQLPQISLQKVDQRARTAGDERRKLTDAFNAGISADGVKVFLTLAKTLSIPLSWNDDSIVVGNIVKISPPYKVENCVAIKQNNDDALIFTKKLVTKYWEDKQKKQSGTQTNTQNSVPPTDKPPFSNNKG